VLGGVLGDALFYSHGLSWAGGVSSGCVERRPVFLYCCSLKQPAERAATTRRCWEGPAPRGGCWNVARQRVQVACVGCGVLMHLKANSWSLKGNVSLLHRSLSSFVVCRHVASRQQLEGKQCNRLRSHLTTNEIRAELIAWRCLGKEYI
jgi:hypothetical protein